MINVQEVYAWWFHNVFSPFAKFVILDHFALCLGITALAITILLGVFYEEDPHGWDAWAEKWGYPLGILILGTLFLPPSTVLIVLVLPALIMFTMPIGALLCLYRFLRSTRERYIRQKRGDYR